MEAQIIDRSSNAVHEVEHHKFDMDKCSEAESAEDWDRAGRFDGNMDGQDLLAYISDTQDFLEEMEGRLLVSAMVTDAVTNGMVNAVLEESSEALAGKETEIVALNDKLEDRDAKLWKLEETLRYNQEELVIHIAESRSDRDRLVMDFMHEKDRMQRKLHERMVCLEEKEKQLAGKTERMFEMETKLKAEENRISALEQQIKSLQEADSSNRKEIAALVEELKRAQMQQETDHLLVREGTLQNEHIENLHRVIKEKNEHIGFLERSISEKDQTIMSLDKRNSLQLQNIKNLEVIAREESEGQMLRREIERCVENIIYEGQLLELSDMLEKGRLQSRTVIFDIQQKIERLKEDSETELTTKKLEISDLAEQLEENEIFNGLQSSIIVGILETFIQEFEYQMSQFRQDLDFKNGNINSLAGKLDCLRLECERLQAQISSNHVIDAEIENNLSTLKATMQIQCSKLKEELEGERATIRDNLRRITKLQTTNDSLAERLREHKLNLEQLEEKMLEQQWQQETGCQLVNQVYESKLIEAMQLISDLNSKLQKKDMELASYLKTVFALETDQNADRPEVLRLQKRSEGFESQIGSLTVIDLHKVDSVFDYINSKFLDMTLKLDGFEESSKIFFQHIQRHVALFQEEHLEQQWKYDFEEQISELVLRGFLKDLEGWLKIKEQEERKPSMLQVRWDEGRVALVNELNCLRQELDLLKIEDPVKSSVNSDGGNSNGFQYFSQLKQEMENGASPDGQRKDRPLRRFSAGQLSTDTSKLGDNSYITAPTGKNAGHSSKEPDLSRHTQTEIADVLESPLKSMSKEQLTAHYKRVVAELRREHECIVEDKTEEIYKLKRELLKEKDSLHSKKDKELNVSKKRIAEITGKLVKLVEENDKLSLAVVEDQNYKMVCRLKDEMQVEKISLLEKVTEKEVELKALSDKLSDALRKDTEHSLTESFLLNHIAELESEKAEMDIMTLNTIDILSTLFEETVKERESSLSVALKERDHIMREKVSLEEKLHEKDSFLNKVYKEKEELQQQIALPEKLIKEKANASRVSYSELKQTDQIEEQKKMLGRALEECEELKKQKQKLCLQSPISHQNDIVDSVIREQEELKEQVLSIKKAVEEKETALNMASRDLEEARKEKEVLEGIIKEKENTLYLFSKKEEDQRKQIEAIIAEKENACTAAARIIKEHKEIIFSLEKNLKEKELSLELSVKGKEEELQQKYLLQAEVQKLKMAVKNMQMHIQTIEKQNKIEVAESVKKCVDASLELERRVMEKIQENVSRLEQNKQQLKKLHGRVDALVSRESYYKEKLERKCCNLRKAEEEVDLLGDEVDALLSLLEKVYAALDHYSPVLQHYPGILDLLKLIKRELMDHVDSGL